MSKPKDSLQQRTSLLLCMQARQISHSTKEEIFKLLAKSKDKELTALQFLEIVNDNEDEEEILRLAKEITLL